MANVKEAKIELSKLQAAQAELEKLEAELNAASSAYADKLKEVDSLILADEIENPKIDGLQAYLATRQNPGD